MRGATDRRGQRQLPDVISIRAPHAGSDGPGPRPGAPPPYFNPRSPCGERPIPTARSTRWRDFNPRSPCGERRNRRRPSAGQREISIRAPLAGSDRPRARRLKPTPWLFQSALPLRGATTYESPTSRPSDFNPRSPCGERPLRARPCRCPPYFNPRSPCGERHPPPRTM